MPRLHFIANGYLKHVRLSKPAGSLKYGRTMHDVTQSKIAEVASQLEEGTVSAEKDLNRI